MFCLNGTCVCPNNNAPLGTNLNCMSCYDTCRPPQTCCPGIGCRDLTGDPNNCNSCGRKCPWERICVGRSCVCPSGLTDCGPSFPCRDLMNDSLNCGWCGHFCPEGQICSAGKCVGGNGGPQCAVIGDSCVPDAQPGTHCCQTSPARCVYEQCRSCLPHGKECFPNQMCCDTLDTCKLDLPSEKTICSYGGSFIQHPS
jgi:hypothetical protein